MRVRALAANNSTGAKIESRNSRNPTSGLHADLLPDLGAHLFLRWHTLCSVPRIPVPRERQAGVVWRGLCHSDAVAHRR